jgi:hypothetical protein
MEFLLYNISKTKSQPQRNKNQSFEQSRLEITKFTLFEPFLKKGYHFVKLYPECI